MKLMRSSIVLAITLVVFMISGFGSALQSGPAVYSPGAKGVQTVQTNKKSGEISVTLAISPPKLKEITARNGQRYIQLDLEGSGNDNISGRAALPIINHTVQVPWNAKVTAQSISRNFKEFSVAKRLYPYQLPIPKVLGSAGNPPFELDEQFYSGPQSKTLSLSAEGICNYIHDHLYSPVAFLSVLGGCFERYEYDAYGNYIGGELISV